MGILWRFFWLSCFLCLYSSQALGVVTATFVEEARVMDGPITLAHIAHITPENETTRKLGELAIASAPAPGQSKQLHAPSIIASLRGYQEAQDVYWTGSAAITVYREGVQIDQDKLQKIIADYLASQADILPEGEIRFTTFRSPAAILLPYGEVTWKVTPSRPDILSSTSFSIYFYVDGKPTENCTVRGKMELLNQVVTAVKTIRRGTQISANQIELAEKNVLPLEGTFARTSQVVGMVAKRTLPPGRPISEKDLATAPTVTEGQYVKIVAQKGLLQISANGIAKASGGTGELIRVKNISSNKLIYAKIVGPGVVSVEF